MTAFSCVWLIIVIWAFSKSNIKYMLSITLLFMTFQCDNVFIIGDFGVGPQLPTSALLMVKIAIAGKKRSTLRRGSFSCALRHRTVVLVGLYALLLAVIISLLYNGVFQKKILNLLQLMIYMFCFHAILSNQSGMNLAELYIILRKIILFLLVVGAVQLLTTTGILPLRPILKLLFYNDNAPTVYFNRENYSRLLSTFMEPSYFAGLLVGAFYYFLSLRDRWKENYILLAAIFIELILTMSSTAYAAFCITGLAFLLLQRKISVKFKIYILLFAVAGFCILYFGFYDVLDTVIFSKSKSGSYLTRTNMNAAAYRSYQESIWFGVGYKNVRGSSIYHSLLGETGRLGLITYLFLNAIILLPIIRNVLHNNQYNNDYYGTLYAVLSIFICQLIACPDLDLCTYWFWMYVFAVQFVCSVDSRQEESASHICSKRKGRQRILIR